MPTEDHWCRIYMDIAKKITKRDANKLAELTHESLLKAAPNMAKKLADIEPNTIKESITNTTQAFFINVTIKATAEQADTLLENVLPILKQAIVDAGYEYNQGWGERRLLTTGRFANLKAPLTPVTPVHQVEWPADSQQCQFFLDIKGKLKAREIEQICDITYQAMVKAGGDAFENKIADIEAQTAKDRRFDKQTGRKVKMGARAKSLFVNADVNGLIPDVDDLLERTVPILRDDLEAAGFEVAEGYGQRLTFTKAYMARD